jgi:IS30 family transposase
MLAQPITETEIAEELKVDQSTISRDIKVLKEMSQRFAYDLAKSDLAYYYKQCLDGIENVRRKGWEIFNNVTNLTSYFFVILQFSRKENFKAKFDISLKENFLLELQ